MPELDAIVLAVNPLANVRIAGLTAKERAVRVAKRVGATRVLVVERASDAVGWRPNHPVLVIRADQLVHTPLVAPLIDALPSEGCVAAVVPEDPVVQDLTPGSFAGALIAVGAAADAVVATIVSGDTSLAMPTGATRIPHGKIARAPIATPAERRTAHRVLYQILVKPQDNAITRYLYRPVSFPLTRLLVWTPITPNQISYAVAVLVAIGCWFTAYASHGMALLGTAIVLLASYVDCCDGEVARVKLLSSRFGAWIDTVVDELTSVGYTIALGWHCHLAFGPKYFGDLPFDPWLVATVISTAAMLWGIYCIYYNLIVAVGSANSQDYVGSFEVAPGRDATKVRLVPAAPRAIPTKHDQPAWLRWLATYAPYIIRRDFIAWGTLVLAALHWTQVAFVGLALGGVVTAVIVTIDHVRLRSLRRSLARRGLILEAP
ncbi:MAG TPA: CDP-alcohol phosphatidyltransferase family protein [Kofleriaceae bacterium]|nr:CDP-alcohol phosphatidyltransferase family protein [Kofleriaceae bacterium]